MVVRQYFLPLYTLPHAVCIIGATIASTRPRGRSLFIAACALFEFGNTLVSVTRLWPTSPARHGFMLTHTLSNVLALSLMLWYLTWEEASLPSKGFFMLATSVLAAVRQFFTNKMVRRDAPVLMRRS